MAWKQSKQRPSPSSFGRRPKARAGRADRTDRDDQTVGFRYGASEDPPNPTEVPMDEVSYRVGVFGKVKYR